MQGRPLQVEIASYPPVNMFTFLSVKPSDFFPFVVLSKHLLANPLSDNDYKLWTKYSDNGSQALKTEQSRWILEEVDTIKKRMAG